MLQVSVDAIPATVPRLTDWVFVVDYTFASENVPNEHREEFRRTLALLMDRVAFIEKRLPHYYTLLTEVYIERAIQIVSETKVIVGQSTN